VYNIVGIAAPNPLNWLSSESSVRSYMSTFAERSKGVKIIG